LGLAAACAAAPGAAAKGERLRSLEGTWKMEAAYEIQADGKRITTYGEHPEGLMMVDRDGRYAIQIYRPGRASFKAGSKARAEVSELRDAVMGSSTHFGRVEIDRARQQLVFHIQAASFPNWNGATQVRDFDYSRGLLTYRVPAAASGNGTTAYSIWRRAAR
jgi:hypothetical protein